jgi:hypothetical protein
VDTLVRLVNEDLERIRRWSVDNSLMLNVFKTTAMLIPTRIVEDVAGDLITSRDLRVYLVQSLIIPILYTNVVYFCSLTWLEFRRLELALYKKCVWSSAF